MLVPMSAASPEERPRQVILGAIVVLLAVCAAAPALDDELVHDDVPIVRDDPRLTEPGGLAAIWGSDYWPGTRASYNYRPLTTTSFALAARAGLSQRWVNLCCHALCSWLVFVLFLTCRLPPWAACVGAAVFAVHPLHSEVLFTVVGRSELLAAAAGIAYLVTISRGARGWPILLLAAALAAKESAIVLPALALLLRPLVEPGEGRRGLRRFFVRVSAGAVLPVGLFFFARFAVFGTFFSAAGHVSAVYNPLVALATPERWLNGCWLLLRYLGACFLPVSLQADHSLGELELLRGPLDLRWLALLLAAACGLLVLRRRTWRSTPEALGSALVLVALFPVSNVLVTTGVGFAERLAYLPSVGACLVMASAWRRLFDRARTRPRARLALQWATLAVVSLALVQTVRRDRDWQDAEAFTRALVRDAPNGALAHGLRAVHLEESGRDREAEAHLLRALELAPDWADAWDSLGEVRSARSDPAGAAEAWERAAAAASRMLADAHEAPYLGYKAALAWLTVRDCPRARAAAAAAIAASDRPIPPQLEALARRLETDPCHRLEPADPAQGRN
jgi:tetratricopeptide (TPR) repeat protein